MSSREEEMAVKTITREKSSQGMEYPDTVIDRQYSIFLAAIHHDLTWKNCQRKDIQKQRCQKLADHGWRIHPWAASDRCGHFFPQNIFTSNALTSFFGELPVPDGEKQGGKGDELTANYLRTRLNPLDGRLAEPLLLSLDTGRCEGNWTVFTTRPGNETVKQGFRIGWVDMHLFADGLGILAIRTELDRKETITELSEFHRAMRMISSPAFPCELSWQRNKGAAENNKGNDFWGEVVCSQWLGNGSVLGLESPGKDNSNQLVNPGKIVFDQDQNCAKTLIFAELTVPEQDEWLWNMPLADPEIPGNDPAVTTGKWTLADGARQQAIIAGYPTIRDLFTFELGTVCDRGASRGWYHSGRGYQYNIEYIRQIISDNSVEIWEYWSGLVLRDTCTFVSFDPSMPIRGQAESQYYPLYVAAYYLRLRLEQLRGAIIDYDMADVRRGDALKHEFAKFRNHFWFNELTTNFISAEVYTRMKKGMDIDTLFDKVSAEVGEVSAHVRQRWERCTGILISFIILLLPLINMFIHNIVRPWIARHWFAALIIALVSAAAATVFWRWHREKTTNIVATLWRRILILISKLCNLAFLS